MPHSDPPSHDHVTHCPPGLYICMYVLHINNIEAEGTRIGIAPRAWGLGLGNRMYLATKEIFILHEYIYTSIHIHTYILPA